MCKFLIYHISIIASPFRESYMSSSEAYPDINEDCDDPVKSGDEKRLSDMCR